ncbi:guanylate kinase [Aquirhabdus parva]|uniref:Guanylate kinase n=1 Tax=Aquirhabdus parva TaxID=2283318 RepID=A0A345P8S7_9GAMM|nr:guanylate kinase [Aquirhabdus parva]AXI03686.1 guanylate kinase [Aquirhabdus parva]
MAGLLFVVAAASGTGKTSLVKALLERTPELSLSVSHTTRAMRPGEEHGVHYHFTEKTVFEQMIGDGYFIEHAEVFGNYYGTSHTGVSQQLEQGHDVLLEIDWQGAEQVRKIFPKSIQIFIIPPSLKALRERLSNRGQDSEEVIQTRLNGSVEEIRQHVNFDYLIVNDDFDAALSDLRAIIRAAGLTSAQQVVKQQDLLIALLNGSHD